MTNLEKIKNMGLDEMVKFLNSLDCIEDLPWIKWGDNNFCKKCETVIYFYDGKEYECSPCELGEHCPFNMGPDVDWCKEWLKVESK